MKMLSDRKSMPSGCGKVPKGRKYAPGLERCHQGLGLGLDEIFGEVLHSPPMRRRKTG